MRKIYIYILDCFKNGKCVIFPYSHYSKLSKHFFKLFLITVLNGDYASV